MVGQNEIINEIKSNLESLSVQSSQLDKIANLIISTRDLEEALQFSKNFPYACITAEDVKNLAPIYELVSSDTEGKVIVFPKNNQAVLQELRKRIANLQEIKSLNVDKCDPELVDAFILYVISYSQSSGIGIPYFMDLDKLARRCIDLYSLAFQWFCLGDFVNYNKIPSRLKKLELKRKNAYLSVLVKYYGLCINFINPNHFFLRYSEYGNYSGEHLAIVIARLDCPRNCSLNCRDFSFFLL